MSVQPSTVPPWLCTATLLHEHATQAFPTMSSVTLANTQQVISFVPASETRKPYRKQHQLAIGVPSVQAVMEDVCKLLDPQGRVSSPLPPVVHSPAGGPLPTAPHGPFTVTASSSGQSLLADPQAMGGGTAMGRVSGMSHIRQTRSKFPHVCLTPLQSITKLTKHTFSV